MSSEESSPCVHCGLCLDACPTYRLTGLEAESPRGRLYLMDAVVERRMPLDRNAAGHLDSCLGCVACETACPSGVGYGRRIAEFRPLLREADPFWRRAFRASVRLALRSNALQRAAVTAARALDRAGLSRLRRRLPGLALVSRQPRPDSAAGSARVPRRSAQPRARVAVLAGCGAAVFRPSLVAAVTTVLEANDIGIVPLPVGLCCGALAEHDGALHDASRFRASLARQLDDLRVDYLVTAAAGCRAALGEAARSPVARDSRADTASRARLAAKSREVCELLVELEFRAPRPTARSERRIAFHDACHLLHAARVPGPPRAVLAASGATVVDLGENAICCGSAGTYNLVHPGNAGALGRRKAELVEAGGFRDVAVANLGCALQIERWLAIGGRGVAAARVAHPVEYLAEAYELERSER